MKFGPAFFISFGLHIVLGGMLIVSMDFHTPLAPQNVTINATPIEAVVVDKAVIDKQLKKIKDQEDEAKRKEQQRQADRERRAREEEQRRRDEQKRIADLEKQKQRQIEDKKRAEQAAVEARKKREREEKLEKERQQKELERRAAEERARKEKQKREDEARRVREAEQQRQLEKELAEQERLLQEQLEAEQSVRSQQRQKHVLTEQGKYTALIKSTITQNWIVDDSMNGKSCRVNIKLSPSGFVKQVKVLGGDSRVCLAAERAILRAGDLPMSSEADVYEKLKDITITFDK